MTAARGRPRAGRRYLAATGALVAAAAYSSFLVGPAVHSRLSATRSFVSELEAAGQPHRQFFRATDVVSGVLIVMVALAVERALQRWWPTDWRARAGCGLIALMGAASVSDGATRMGCAPSLDAACRARDSSIGGLLSQVTEAHTLSGLAGFVGGALGMVLIGVTLREHSPGWGTICVAAGITLAAIGLVDVGLLAGAGVFGLAERGRALVVSGWLIVMAGFLLRGTEQAAGRRRHPGTPTASGGYAVSGGTGSRTAAAGSSA